MTANNKLATLQKEAPQEIPAFLKAAKLVKKINGISISGDDSTLKEIKLILDFSPKTKEGEELKKNIIKKASLQSQKGLTGEGIFLID